MALDSFGKLMILVIIFSLTLLSGCSTNVPASGLDTAENPAQNPRSVSIDKLEIYHFHGTNQCYSCKTVGAYTEDTINTYFADELKTGKIVFAHVNVDLPENKELAAKYGATGSSLWLGVYDKEGFHKENNVNVWYKINNKWEFTGYLKGIIDKRLAGDLN
ncbi:MAG: nitrophenyl compound nitroreductase subunit ArsF family protein [Nanoarchaeota archaeon]